MPEEKIDTLLSKGQIPIIDLAHCGKWSILQNILYHIYHFVCEEKIVLIFIRKKYLQIFGFALTVFDQIHSYLFIYCCDACEISEKKIAKILF